MPAVEQKRRATQLHDQGESLSDRSYLAEKRKDGFGFSNLPIYQACDFEL
jgi:hypothetical protein